MLCITIVLDYISTISGFYFAPISGLLPIAAVVVAVTQYWINVGLVESLNYCQDLKKWMKSIKREKEVMAVLLYGLEYMCLYNYGFMDHYISVIASLHEWKWDRWNCKNNRTKCCFLLLLVTVAYFFIWCSLGVMHLGHPYCITIA